jgi:hypothetical protein
VAGGGALVASGAVLLLIRSADVSTLNRDCPGGLCRAGSNRGELESTRDRALVEGPLGLALGAAGVIGAGVGGYLVWSADRRASTPAPRPSSARVTTWSGPSAFGVAVRGTFR